MAEAVLLLWQWWQRRREPTQQAAAAPAAQAAAPACAAPAAQAGATTAPYDVQLAHDFTDLLGTSKRRADANVVSRAIDMMRVRMSLIVRDRDIDAANEVYDEVGRALKVGSHTIRMMASNGLSLNGPFSFHNDKLVRALHKGVPAMVKLLEEDGAKHHNKFKETFFDDPNMLHDHVCRFEILQLERPVRQDTSMCTSVCVMQLYAMTLGDSPRFEADILAESCIGLMQAVEHLHKAKWVHVDIKPDNVLIDTIGRFVLADFGSSICEAMMPAGTELNSTQMYIPDCFTPRPSDFSHLKLLDWHMMLSTVAEVTLKKPHACAENREWLPESKTRPRAACTTSRRKILGRQEGNLASVIGQIQQKLGDEVDSAPADGAAS